MYSQMALNCTYQRKMFPGLIFRPQDSPVVLLCFFSGKIVITGGKNMEDVYAGWDRLWPTLKKFVNPHNGTPLRSPSMCALKKSKCHQGGKTTSVSHDGRERHEGIPLERHTSTCDSGGAPNTFKEPSRGGRGRTQVLDLLETRELQGLCDDLTAECGPFLMGRGLASGTADEGREPRDPHPPVIKDDVLVGHAATELQA
jgi:hypothetical protein